jgi:glutaredoxin
VLIWHQRTIQLFQNKVFPEGNMTPPTCDPCGAAANPAEKKSYKDQLANNTKPKANNNNNQKKIVENKITTITTSTTAPTSTDRYDH